MCNSEDVVWIPEERVYGFIRGGLGAHMTTVWYIKDGVEFEVFLENDEFEIMEEGPLEYDED